MKALLRSLGMMLGASVLALVFAGVSTAGKPVVTEIVNPLQSLGVDPLVSSVCGFDVEIFNEGRVRITDFSDGTRTLGVHEAYYWTANGKSLTEYDNRTIVFGTDESTTVHGTVFNVQVPGAGVVLKEAGTVVFDRDGNIVRMAGLHQVLDGTGNIPAICDYLSA